MLVEKDLLLGKLALKDSLLTQEQLYDCILFQERNPGKRLGSIMVSRGYIKQEQLNELLEKQRKVFAGANGLPTGSKSGLLLGRLLIDKGLASEYQVNECLRTQARLAEIGINPVPHLGEIMLRKDYISLYKLQTALIMQHPELYTCPDCETTIDLKQAVHDEETYVCKNCFTTIPTVFARMAGSLHDQLEKISDELDLGIPEDVRAMAADPRNYFGKYIQLREIGRGGAGVVYKAWQQDYNKIVALKILSHKSQTAAGIETPYGDAEDLKRFYNEIKACADLDYPGIVPILDFGIEQNHFYYAMKYVEGNTVDTLVAGGKRPPINDVLNIIMQVAKVLDYAYKKGVYHRDIKPSNIILDKDGNPWIMDFGLAKIVAIGDSAYVRGVIMGTPYYMPPEQASGDMEQVDHLSDIYSLGAVMYELVTGYCPYVGRSPDTVVDILATAQPANPRQYVKDLPLAIEKIIKKSMAKFKADRYQSCGELIQDIQSYLDGKLPEIAMAKEPFNPLKLLRLLISRIRSFISRFIS